MHKSIPGIAALLLALVMAVASARDLPEAAPPDSVTRASACLNRGRLSDLVRRGRLMATLAPYDNWQPDQLRDRIRDISEHNGPLSPDLVPAYVALGLDLQNGRNYRDAALALQRALHVVRANDGLYSMEQAPIIDLLIRSRGAANDWLGVANAWDLLDWLYRRHYAPDDPGQLDTLLRVRRWHIEAYNRDTGRKLEDHYKAARAAYERASAIVRHCTGDPEALACFWNRACCGHDAAAHRACKVNPDAQVNFGRQGESNEPDDGKLP